MRKIQSIIIKNPAFTRYWIGTSLSQIGDQFATVALAWLVLSYSHSASAIAIVLASYSLPVLLSSIFAGVLLDRGSRKFLLIFDNSVRGVMYLLIPLLYHSRMFSIANLALIMVVSGCLSSITRTGEIAIIPNMVNEEDLESANAIVQVSWQLAYLIGPALGGIFTGIFGADNTLIINAISFWAFAILIGTISEGRFQIVESNFKKLAFMSDLKQGLKMILNSRMLVIIALVELIFNFLYGPLEPGLPVFVKINLLSGPRLLGYLWASLSLGMIIGTFVWMKLKPDLDISKFIVLIMGGWGIFNVILGLSRSSLLALAMMLFAGMAFGPYNITILTYQQKVIPDPLRGRVLGTIFSFTGVGLPLGQLVGGWAVSYWGAPSTILISGVVCLLLGAGAYLSLSKFRPA